MMQALTSLIATYGYIVVMAVIGLESMGVPLPGETALLVAAAYAGAGHLRIELVILAAGLAAIVGDSAGYWLGRRGGRVLLERQRHWLHLRPATFDRVDSFFARHGSKAVFFGRFVGVLRTYVALFAGLSGMPYRRFVFFNIVGGSCWAVLFGVLGYVFGQNLALVERWVRIVGWGVLGMIGLIVAGIVMWRWIATNRARLRTISAALLTQPWVARVHQRYRRQWQWLGARLTPGGYLGLYVTLGFWASIACMWLFGGLVEDIVERDPLVQFDFSVVMLLHRAATPVVTTVCFLLSELGGSVALILAVVVALLYVWRRQWLHAGTWIIALGGGEALNMLMKTVVARPRPMFAIALGETDGSFPSGHAMGALIVYGLLAYFAVLVLKTWRARAAVVGASALMILLIGFSRLYLGVHYLSDVVGGYAAAGSWLSTCITGMEIVRRGELGGHRQQRARRWTRPGAQV